MEGEVGKVALVTLLYWKTTTLEIMCQPHEYLLPDTWDRKQDGQQLGGRNYKGYSANNYNRFKVRTVFSEQKYLKSWDAAHSYFYGALHAPSILALSLASKIQKKCLKIFLEWSNSARKSINIFWN